LIEASTKKASTRAKLSVIREAFDYCGDEGFVVRNKKECISKFMEKLGFDPASPMFIYDTYGEKIILEVPEGCLGKNPRVPYSKGPNKIDECGAGDDIE
jgi:hypothetical protein